MEGTEVNYYPKNIKLQSEIIVKKLKFLLEQIDSVRYFCIHTKVNKYSFLNHHNFRYAYKLNLSYGQHVAFL